MIYTNYYLCECGAEWSDDDDCMCDDRCPRCCKAMTPYASDSGLMTQEEIATARLRAIGQHAALLKPIKSDDLAELLRNVAHYSQAINIKCPICQKPVGHCNHEVVRMAAAKQLLDHLDDGPDVIYTFPEK